MIEKMNELVLVVSCNLQGLAWKGLEICSEQLHFAPRCMALELVVAYNLQGSMWKGLKMFLSLSLTG